MIRAIKAVSTERGRDPREFALFAFGGNGPLFAAGMAAALGIKRIVVPPSAGLFSSFGLLYADVEHHYARTFRRLLRQRGPERDRCGLECAGATGERPARGRGLHRRARAAQALGGAALQGPELRADRAGAGRPDRRAHGRASGGSVRRRARAHLRPSRRARRAGRAGRDPGRRLGSAREHACRRAAWPQPANDATRAAPGLFRPSRAGSRRRSSRARDLRDGRAGPLIVEEYDATCLVPPGARAELDAAGNIVIEL